MLDHIDEAGRNRTHDPGDLERLEEEVVSPPTGRVTVAPSPAAARTPTVPADTRGMIAVPEIPRRRMDSRITLLSPARHQRQNLQYR